MGSVHHLIKFIPKLAELTEPLRPLLKKTDNKNNRLKWNDTHSQTFTNIKQRIKQIIENKHFDTTKETRIKCDASNKGLGASIEQKHGNIWHTIAFASRFLNNYESRYSTNELELSAVVWAVEHFKHYLHGQDFKILTDHQALLSALNENRGNKTYQSRLTRWVDRLLPFNFTIEHVPGKDMGFADYLSRNPSQPPPPPSTDDTQFIINTINDFKYILLNDAVEKLSADKHQTQNGVISNKEHATQKTNAFCQKRYNNQPLALATNLSQCNRINSIHSISNSNPIYKSSIKSFQNLSQSHHLINQNQFSSNYNSPVNTLYSLHNPPNSKSPLQQSTLSVQVIKKYWLQLEKTQHQKHIYAQLLNAKEHPIDPKWKTTQKRLVQAAHKQTGRQTRAWEEPHLDQIPKFQSTPREPSKHARV